MASLRNDIAALSSDIGERNDAHPEQLARAAAYVEERLGPVVTRETFDVDGQTFVNLVVEVRGASAPKEVVVVGAHYDTAIGTPGADDNASGVAALLALAERFPGRRPDRTVRFVAFANEEPPFSNSRAWAASWPRGDGRRAVTTSSRCSRSRPSARSATNRGAGLGAVVDDLARSGTRW